MQTKRRTRTCVLPSPFSTNGRAAFFAAAIAVLMVLSPNQGQAQLLGENELVEGVKDGDIPAVEEALLSGLPATERSARGTPILILAIRTGKKKMVELLLERGARVNVADNRTRVTPIEEATRTNRPDLVKLLIKEGADVEKSGTDGETPVMIAAKLGHTAVLELFIAEDAYLNDTDRTGRTPLMLAQERRHKDTVAVLMAAGAE